MRVVTLGLFGLLLTQVTQANQQQGFDKSKLPTVQEGAFATPTRVLGDLVTGGGIIENISKNKIHLRTGDFVVMSEDAFVSVQNDRTVRHRSDILTPGMAIAYQLRSGRLAAVRVIGIVESPAVDNVQAIFKRISELKLQPRNKVINTSLSGEKPMTILVDDEKTAVLKVGESKLIELPKPTTEVQWRIGDYRPETIDDIKPFEYLLVRWRPNGHITWTCYAAPENND